MRVQAGRDFVFDVLENQFLGALHQGTKAMLFVLRQMQQSPVRLNVRDISNNII